MATNPTFPGAPNLGVFGLVLTTAHPEKDGTTADLVWTAGLLAGEIKYVVARAKGANTATVLRVFINNGGAVGTPGNNILHKERTIVTTVATEVAEQPDNRIDLDLALPAGHRIYVAIGTAVAAGLAVSAVGHDF
jgi:hypothetical protein